MRDGLLTTGAGGGTVKNKKQQPKPRARQTAVYITDAMHVRLQRYLLAKYPGRLNVRNTVIIEAINEKLSREGF